MSRSCLLLACFQLLMMGCVQPTYQRIVVYELAVPELDSRDAMAVAVRGDDKPLSWQEDRMMTPVDTSRLLYRTVVTYKTGYLSTTVKFVVNGEFELSNNDNRNIVFSQDQDTTYYQAIYNVAPEETRSGYQ